MRSLVNNVNTLCSNRMRRIHLLSNLFPATQASNTQEEEEGVTMILLIQEQRRQRVREDRRLGRSKIPLERHIWEREEEEERAGADAASGRFSRCTSLSNSTLTDSEHPPVGSEADTMSEPHSPELQDRPHHRCSYTCCHCFYILAEFLCKTLSNLITPCFTDGLPSSSVNSCILRASSCVFYLPIFSSMAPNPQNTSSSKDGRKQDGTLQALKSFTLPSVGTWVFELEDEEYPCFLELFLSYIMEKDSLDMDESELPLLNSFSSCLRERELHSDTFDILTALKRRQAGRKKDVHLPVFRAGSCFHMLPETPEPLPSIGPPPSVLSEAPTARTSTGALPLLGKQPGLFSVRRQNETPLRQNVITTESSPIWNLTAGIPQTERWPFKAISCPDVDVQLELDSKLEAQFPQLARLLEWMLRWADRSVLLTHSSRKKTGSAMEPVVIRAKASAPAVLFALTLLEQRYTKALLSPDKHYIQIRVRYLLYYYY